LFTMSTDKQLDGGNANETFIIAYDDGGNTFDILDSEGWDTAEIALDTSHPVFYSSDGILRIGDGALTNDGQWYGYISGAKFDGINADSGDINAWVNVNQKITSPTAGICLISDPEIGADGNTVNSTNAEYDGNIADGSGTREPLVHSSVNLRIGFQKTEVFENDATAWSRASGSPFQSEVIAEPAESVVYPVLGNNVLFLEGTDGIFHQMNLNNNDAGTTLSFNMGEGEGIMFGVKMSQAELDLLDNIVFSVSSGTGNIDWKFYHDELVADVWNICVANRTNYAYQSTTEIDDDFTSMTLRANQKYGGAYGTANASNHSSDIYYSTPVKTIDSGLEGYQIGLYTFYYSWLYDDAKQESLPFLFTDTAASDVNKVNIVGGSVLFNFDTYINPYLSPVACTIDVTDHQIDKASHGLLAGAALTFSGVTNANIDAGGSTDNTAIFYVSSESNVTGAFRISSTYANAIAGTSIDFTGTDDSSGVDYHIYGISKRITGSRLYYKSEENDNYFLIGELDFDDNGFKWFPEGDIIDYPMVDSGHAAGLLAKASLIKEITPSSANVIDTFKNINGYSTSVKSLEAKYKTAVVQGRRTYIGNVKKDGETHPDRMIKSRVNKFDVFPSKMGVVDVAIRDGESIIKLEAFADRILQFKEKSLYVINVSENVDFLEDVYRNKGIAFDYQTTKTDFGIAWFNSFGVYFYDGKQVTNLLEKNGMRLISESDWETFITASDADMSEAHIGYIPKKRQLLIKRYHASSADIFIYDFVLKAWMKGETKANITTNMTNFALDSDQDLFYLSAGNSSIVTWNPSSAVANSFLYTTKDIDFGEPGVRKKIYKVYVTYQSGGAATNVVVDYDVNGGTTFPYDFQDGTNFASTELSSASGWQQAVLKPDNSSEANNIYSFQLRFQANASDPNTAAGFEINDISIVYRMKSIR